MNKKNAFRHPPAKLLAASAPDFQEMSKFFEEMRPVFEEVSNFFEEM
jgi:hypothetical protein